MPMIHEYKYYILLLLVIGENWRTGNLVNVVIELYIQGWSIDYPPNNLYLSEIAIPFEVKFVGLANVTVNMKAVINLGSAILIVSMLNTLWFT